MFGYSKYKMYYIENLLPPEGSSVYKCGSLVDLCLGPHIQNTGKIKAFKVMKVSLEHYRLECTFDWFTRIRLAIFAGIRMMTPSKGFTV